MSPFRSSFRAVITASVLSAALLTAACAPTVNLQGNIVRASDLERVQVGQDTRASVAAQLGNPSTVSNFEDDVWYYVGQRTEQTAFFKPEIVERQIVAITFQPGGQVANVQTLTLEDGKVIAFVERETPTAGQSITVLQQVIGNIGRFQDTFGNAGN